jgi:hypothetical protein
MYGTFLALLRVVLGSELVIWYLSYYLLNMVILHVVTESILLRFNVSSDDNNAYQYFTFRKQFTLFSQQRCVLLCIYSLSLKIL